jgi:hypothetical protein
MIRAAALTLALVMPGTGWSHGALSADDAARKQEGSFVTGLPLVNYTSDTGLGYGARVYLIGDGSRAESGFANRPYDTRLFAQFFSTTGGWQYHTLDLDAPELVTGLPVRVRAYAAYEANTDRRWFGAGSASLASLPGGSMAAYQQSLNDAHPAGGTSTSAAFNRYELIRPVAGGQLEREFGSLTLMAGGEVEHGTVKLYDGRTVTVDGSKRAQGPTLVGQVRPAGIDGGWVNHLRVGCSFDTRDFEPDPRTGWYADTTAEYSGPALASDYAYTRETAAVRRFQEVLPGLVLASRATYTVVQGQPPFYDLSWLGYTDARHEGLGSGWSLRGFRETRFTGNALGLVNAEVRYNVGEQVWGGQRFALKLVGFGDTGRVFDSGRRLTLRDWKADAGGGVRIAWNLSTVLNATYGRSGEDSNIFIDFGHMF